MEQRLSNHTSSSIEDIHNKFKLMLCSFDYDLAGGTNDFSASLEGIHLGALDLLRYEGQHGLRGGRRNINHIRENEIDQFLVIFPLTGLVTISQSGRQSIVEPGRCVLLTTARPFDSSCSYNYAEYVIRIPGSIIRQQVPHIDECCAKSIAIEHGAGKILRSLTENLLEERNNYSNSQAIHFGTILRDAVANVARESPELAGLQSQQRVSTCVRIYERAKVFIESDLSNPGLNPALVADHCHISTSYLHAVFATYPQSVGALIREMRLQRSREALLNASLHHQPITQIAMRWGFSSSSSFNHAYRARFEKSPSEERQTLIET